MTDRLFGARRFGKSDEGIFPEGGEPLLLLLRKLIKPAFGGERQQRLGVGQRGFVRTLAAAC